MSEGQREFSWEREEERHRARENGKQKSKTNVGKVEKRTRNEEQHRSGGGHEATWQ